MAGDWVEADDCKVSWLKLQVVAVAIAAAVAEAETGNRINSLHCAAIASPPPLSSCLHI